MNFMSLIFTVSFHDMWYFELTWKGSILSHPHGYCLLVLSLVRTYINNTLIKENGNEGGT